MSHVRSTSGARQMSSQGARVPASPPQQLSLEEMRQRMLFRRPVDLQLNRMDIERPAEEAPTNENGTARHVFVGRSLVIANSPQHPSNCNDATDPHKLFQMLRRKKKNAAAPERPPALSQPTAAISTFVSYTRQSPDRSDPLPRMDCGPDPKGDTGSPNAEPTIPRPQAAHRPMAADNAARHAMSAGASTSAKRLPTREVHSATPAGSTPDGRPFTRQKPLSQSLDLFESANGKHDDDPFPRPAPRKLASRQRLVDAKAALEGKGAGGAAQPNFQCLFVSGDGDLDGAHEEFPSPKTQVDIPLIETDWFSTASFEELPDPADINNGADMSISLPCEDDNTTQSLYELLVAQKSRKSRRA